jgi:hypothetical protein
MNFKYMAKVMRKHKYEKLIDDYLFNNLNKEKEEEFEQHYFNCPSCFKKLKDREEFISIIKHTPNLFFHNLDLKNKSKKELFFKRISTFLTPSQWAGAILSPALLLIVIFIILPNIKTPSSQFSLDSNAVRGRSITIIPDTAPTHLKWKSMGENIEYNISIYDNQLIWEETISENSISLPDEVYAQMTPGVKYFWQVKAYSQEGTLIAKSSMVQLMFINK